MDYDDNDFQNQNFQLVGDESNRFPPSLRSFALPKFDLDEHLQVHLRFDSLIETEVLLGIQGQDNNWIEEFSPGTSAIEFSSSAAESCSISRHTNVWSEATSSESVEMLLKSVGEDEMKDKKAVIMEADAQNVLSRADDRVDISLRQDSEHNSKRGDTIQPAPAHPADKCLENLSRLDEDNSGGQHQVEDISQTSTVERSGVELTVEEQGTIDQNLTSPLDDTSRNLVSNEIICVSGQNDDLSDIHFMKSTTPDDCGYGMVAGESPDSYTCRSTEVPSSASVSDLVQGDEKLNSQVLSEQAKEGDAEISMMERTDLPPAYTQKVKSDIMSPDGRQMEVPEVKSQFCGGNNSSFLDPAMDSLELMSEGDNECGFAENSDGLLEAIAYQVKALNKDSEAGSRFPTEVEGTYSLGKEGDCYIEACSIEIADQDITKLPHSAEGTQSVSCDLPDHLPKTDSTRVEVPTETVGEGRTFDTFMEVIEEKQCAGGRLPENDDGDVGENSEMAVEVNSEVQIAEMESNSGLTPQNPESAVVEKGEDEITKDVEKPEANLDALEDILPHVPPLPALHDNAEVEISSPLPGKVDNMPEVDKLVTEHEVDKMVTEPSGPNTTPEVPVRKESIVPYVDPSNPNSNNEGVVLLEKAEDMSFAGQTADAVTIVHGSLAYKMTQDESGVAGLCPVGAEYTSPGEPTDTHQLHPVGSVIVSRVVGHKEETSSLSQPDAICCAGKEVKKSGTSSVSVAKNNPQLHSEPIMISSPSGTDDGSPYKRMMQDESGVKVDSHDIMIDFHQSKDTLLDVIVEQKEEATSSPLKSEFSNSHREVHAPADSSLLVSENIANTPLSSRPVADNDICEHALNTASKQQPIVVEQPSSCVKSAVRVTCQDPLVDKPITHENAMQIDEDLVVRGSAAEEKRDFDSSMAISQEHEGTNSSVSADTSSHDKQQTLPEPSSAGNTSSGGDLNGCQNTSTLSRSNTDAESGKPSSFEPSCGSPTVISCSGHSQKGTEYQEGSNTLSDQKDPGSHDVLKVSDEQGGSMDKIKSIDHDSKENISLEDDKSFTFEVGSLADLPERDAGNEWKPFSSMQSFAHPQISKKNSRGRHAESREKQHRVMTKTPDGDKASHVTGSSDERLTTTKVKAVKETTNSKKSVDKGGKTRSTSPLSVGTISRDLQLEEIRQHTYTESSSSKTSCSSIVQSSSLPDLNSSIAAAALFHQPFSDVQQVQLRAQIFVYGSLIQGIPPDEACMISAFGETDGGRSFWEGVWRTSVERFQNQKSPIGNYETPLQSRSGARMHEQVTRCSSLQSNASDTPNQSGKKTLSAAVLSSTSPLPSPLWSIPTHDGLHSNIPRSTYLDFNQAPSPLYPYHSSQTRQCTSTGTPWLSQNARPGSWVVSAQSSTLSAVTQYSTVPVVETVQVTPTRDLSVPRAANMQLVSPSTLLPTSSPVSVSAASVSQIETQKKTDSPASNKNTSSIQKSRRRKKPSGTEDLGLNVPVSQSSTDPASANVRINLIPVSSSSSLPSNTPNITSGTLVPSTPHFSPTHYQTIGSGDIEQRVIISEETSSRIEQAKQQAENAAALAASAVSHCRSIWNQLAAQRNSGLVTEVEEKLASAAVAAAAAASVAKAAAAATKIASDAALQAKMMADEALNSVKPGNPPPSFETEFDVGEHLVKLTPGSILKGNDKIHGSTSVISAAREVARRRVEAASAAAKRAENLDAIVKAAELAAEAVSQAGTIIAMGDPLPFKMSELVEAGPEGFWKVRSASEKPTKMNNVLGGLNPGDHQGGLVKELREHHSNNKKVQKTTNIDAISVTEQSMHLEENIQADSGNGSINALAVPDDRHGSDHLTRYFKENGIQKGSLVEVVSDEEGLRGVWFSAQVLDMKDNKAYVCYSDLLPEEGSGQLKEWVSLEGEGNAAPRIRIAHPMTLAKYEGTRKRRREAVGNYVWAVGDRVDAWIRDGWWEGIVSEKCHGDETRLTVHFPAGGDSALVRAWNLRPSLVWKDGQWMEWSRPRESMLEVYAGDTPQEKRQKLGTTESKIDAEVDGKGIGKLSKNMSFEDLRKPEEPRGLNLSAKDQIFSVGNTNVSDALKVKRTGLQKEGSRVVFGVPKPGKKRKFMEVSKHYVSDKTGKMSEGNDSLKFAKYLMPQASRGWRNTSKADHKGKQASVSKPRVLKSVKSQNIQTKGTAVKGTSNPTASALNGGENGPGSLLNTKSGFGNEENSEKKSSLEAGPLPSSRGTADCVVAETSMQPLSGVPVFKKLPSATEAGLGPKERPSATVDKSTRSVAKASENTISDAVEPRRSNRRIQPTSRLLEGLQSSLIISKIPSISHDRGAAKVHGGAKVQHRSSSSRGSSRG